MSQHLLIYPILPAIIAGIINWIYWKRKGFSSFSQLVMSILIFYAVFYGLFRLLHGWIT